MSKLELKTSRKNGGRIVAEHQHPFDYVEERGELVPVQVRLPTKLSEGVKARLQKHDMTFTERIRGACHWYLHPARAPLRRLGLFG